MALERAGKAGKTTKKHRRFVRYQGRRIGRMVRMMHDALFLEPGREDVRIKRLFSARAAATFIRTGAGVPAAARRIKTYRRRARIGIDAGRTRTATALVSVRARGLARERRFRIGYRARLWLQRTRGNWKVIAFDVDQSPMRRGAHRDEQKGRNDTTKPDRAKRKKRKNRNGDKE